MKLRRTREKKYNNDLYIVVSESLEEEEEERIFNVYHSVVILDIYHLTAPQDIHDMRKLLRD